MKVRVSSGKEVEDLYTAAEPSPAQEPGLKPHTHTQILRFSYNAKRSSWNSFQQSLNKSCCFPPETGAKDHRLKDWLNKSDSESNIETEQYSARGRVRCSTDQSVFD